MSERRRHAHSERPRGLVRLRMMRGTPLAIANAIRTSGAACHVVFERTPSRHIELSRARPL